MGDRTPEEVDRMAADIVDLAILAAGGDIALAERVLSRTPFLACGLLMKDIKS